MEDANTRVDKVEAKMRVLESKSSAIGMGTKEVSKLRQMDM